MVVPDGERLARLEEQVSGVREDVIALTEEVQRGRKRMHNLEGFAAMFAEQQKENRRKEADQYRRLELRISVLTLVVGLAAVVSPIVLVVLVGK